MMTADLETENLVRDALRAHLRVSREIGDDEPILSSGIVDSLGVLEFVAAIEKATGTPIHVTEMTLENLDSIRRIAALLRKHRTGPGTAGA